MQLWLNWGPPSFEFGTDLVLTVESCRTAIDRVGKRIGGGKRRAIKLDVTFRRSVYFRQQSAIMMLIRVELCGHLGVYLINSKFQRYTSSIIMMR